jgi:hypothetical protein
MTPGAVVGVFQHNAMDARGLGSGFNIDARASQPFGALTLPPTVVRCHTRLLNGPPLPDPKCTPGAINPTVTAEVLRDPTFHTTCVRQQVTTEHEKALTIGIQFRIR